MRDGPLQPLRGPPPHLNGEALSVLPRVFGMAGDIYTVGVLVIGAAFVYTSFRVLRELDRPGARNVLLASVVYLPVLYGLLVFDRGL